MSLSIQDWHNRFLIQAQWTRALRLYFFDLIKLEAADKILDIGCGTGALLPDLQSLSPADIYGADVSLDPLKKAALLSPESNLIGANVHNLPFNKNAFDMVLSHYFLMWVGNTIHALNEMVRVTKPGGYIVAFAEPDYGGRIDHPPEFIKLRDYQISGLTDAGADPSMGRKLPSLFHDIGLQQIHCGVYDGRWESPLSKLEIESEWLVLEDDLRQSLTPQEISDLKNFEQTSLENGSRLIYVPTFYAWGMVKK